MARSAAQSAPFESIADALLAWYDRHHRELPWRVTPGRQQAGERADPYRVWLSEIMLQQTTVQAVGPFYAKFLALWPTVADLAAADEEDVLKAWAGLGYYSRARNLKRAAEAVVNDHGGAFPSDAAGLRSLPGIGDYTAGAVAAIAFNRAEPVVDGNVERVFTRLFAIETPLPAAKPDIRKRVAAEVPAARPGDFAQATMDLGATICTPRRPSCILCPLRDRCMALRNGDPERFPLKALKKEKPVRRAAAFVAVDPAGAVLLRKRAGTGLLAGMSEVPTSEFTARLDGDTSVDAAPFPAAWRLAGTIKHIFTHFELRLDVYWAELSQRPATNIGWWSTRDDISGEALPTVMKKALACAIPDIF